MRWFAVATISLALGWAAYGCSAPSDGAVFYVPPDDSGGRDGTAGSASAAKAGGPARSDAGDRGMSDAGSAGTSEPVFADAGSGGDPSAGVGGSTAGGGGNGGMAQVGGSAGAAPTIPEAPSGLLLEVASATSISITWADNSTDESGFNVYWSTDSNKPAQPNLMPATNTTTVLADALLAQTPYHFWVESYNAVGVSAAITGSATPGPVPAQPTGLAVTGGATSLVLNWTDVASGETGYRIFYATSNVQPATPQRELPADAATYTVPSGELTPYTTYYFWVAAYNAIGNGMAAAGSGVVGVLPTAPTALVVSASESVWYQAVSWVDNSASTTSYDIYWSVDDTMPLTPNDSVPAGTTSYRMKQELSAQTYRFWVDTVNVIGKSAATKGTANAATFDIPWTQLYYDDSSRSVHQTVQDTFGLSNDVIPGTATPDTTTGVYGYHAATQSGLGGAGSAMAPGINWSVASAAIDTTVTGYYQTEFRTPMGSLFSSLRSLTPPAPLTGLAAGATTDLSQVLSWKASANAANYAVYFGTGSTLASAALFTSTTGVTAAIPTLNPGVTYNYWVSATGTGLGGSGYIGPAASVSQKTTGTYLGPNLALGKSAVASSVYNGASASNATDNNFNSRWQGNYSTGEWIYVDLGAANAAKISNVELVWEAAYSKTFDVQVCPASCYSATNAVDAWPWQTAYSASNPFSSSPYYQMLTMSTQITGEYVRIKSKTLGYSSTAYGPSLYELEVFSAP